MTQFEDQYEYYYRRGTTYYFRNNGKKVVINLPQGNTANFKQGKLYNMSFVLNDASPTLKINN